MEIEGRSKHYFADAGDGAMANLHQELQRMKRSVRRCQCFLGVLLVVFAIVLLSLIIVVGIQDRRIHHLKQREGLIPHPNVTFASNSGDQKVNGLTYGGSLFRGSGFWSAKLKLPDALTDHAAIGVDDQVYIIGGAQSGNVTNQTLLYDSILHTYTVVAPMPGPRYRFGAALDPSGRKIYVAGGRINDNVPDGIVLPTYIYDLDKNTWSTGANILEGQSDNCAAFLYGKFYISGGYSPDYSDTLAITEVYDPVEDKWTYVAPMPTARGDAMCAAFDGEFYVLGGYVYNGTDLNSFSATVESFNPNTSVWTTQPPMLTPRGDAAVTVLPGDRLMVIGGEGHYKNNDTYKYPKHVNEIYYGADKTWVEKAMIPTARFRTGAATAGGLAFVFGGADVCIAAPQCPALDNNEVFLDTDHPHVYIYLKNEAYDDNAALTTYPV